MYAPCILVDSPRVLAQRGVLGCGHSQNGDEPCLRAQQNVAEAQHDALAAVLTFECIVLEGATL